jgi:hypothetical protein
VSVVTVKRQVETIVIMLQYLMHIFDIIRVLRNPYSTVTDLAKLRGWSIEQPLRSAT